MKAQADATAASGYGERAAQLVPGLRDLHKMVGVLLAERAPHDARILVLGAGGGLELKALADMQPGWRFEGVDPSREMLDLARETLGDLASRVNWCEGLIGSAPLAPLDGATCLLTLHFLSPAERLETLKEMHLRLKPGAPLVIAHHSFSAADRGSRWLERNAAYGVVSGVPVAQAEASISAIRERLPVIAPEQEVELLQEAGFVDVDLFYCAFTFKGWVAYRSDPR
ncbi:MAG: class I SAM-dependent methyltransferase [Burkholderiales bacterium]|nr:MAG: class I SAM-dependent methyltransferase [Burkholderiales bacterium]